MMENGDVAVEDIHNLGGDSGIWVAIAGGEWEISSFSALMPAGLPQEKREDPPGTGKM